jgi:hypothetical protein
MPSMGNFMSRSHGLEDGNPIYVMNSKRHRFPSVGLIIDPTPLPFLAVSQTIKRTDSIE